MLFDDTEPFIDTLQSFYFVLAIQMALTSPNATYGWLLFLRVFIRTNLKCVIFVRRCFPANICLDEDVLKTSYVFVFRRRLKDVLKASSKRLQDVLKR